MGTGPYLVRSWKHGKHIVLAKGPAYWDKQRAGYVDRIELPIYEDVDEMWTAFRHGELDCSQVPSSDVTAVQNGSEVASGRWAAGSWPAAAL